MEITLEEIKENFNQLPEDLQWAIMGAEVDDKIQRIGTLYELNADQTAQLALETYMVLMGVTPLEQFEQSIQSSIGLPKDINNAILKEVNEKIINNVKPELVKFVEKSQLSKSSPFLQNTEKLESRLNILPSSVQGAIDKSNYAAALYTISKEHKFNVPQMGTLEEAVTGVMTGKMHPDKFGDYLQQNLKLSIEENTNLVNEINENIFKPIRENMMLSLDRNTETDTEKNSNDAILKKAGIELGPQNKDTADQIPTMEEREEILSKVEHPDSIQKESTNQIDAVPQKTSNTKPLLERVENIDPYRMPIE